MARLRRGSMDDPEQGRLFEIEGSGWAYKRLPDLPKLRRLSEEECARVVLPRFAPTYNPFEHVAPDELAWIDRPFSRYLKGRKCKGGKCVPAHSFQGSAPLVIQTEEMHEVCDRHRGALLGRNWKTGEYGRLNDRF